MSTGLEFQILCFLKKILNFVLFNLASRILAANNVSQSSKLNGD